MEDNRMSSSITILVSKLCELRKDINEIELKKSTMKTNQFSYEYLGEAELNESIRPLLDKHGILVVPISDNGNYVDTQKVVVEVNGSQKVSYMTTMQQAYLVAEKKEGQYMIIVSTGSGQDSGDKGANKAVTGCIKNVFKALGLIPSPKKEDNDSTPSPSYNKPHTEKNGEFAFQYGEFAGKTIKEAFDMNPDGLEALRNTTKSKFMSDKIDEFYKSIK